MTSAAELAPPTDRLDRSSAFRAVAILQPCSVAVITSPGAPPHGFTASSVVSLSLDPPMVAFSLMEGTRARAVWQSQDTGVIHLLHSGQADVARRFARSSNDALAADLAFGRTADAGPLLDDALAWLAIRATARVLTGDHLTLLCEVLWSRVGRRTEPLVYWQRRFGTTALHRSDRAGHADQDAVVGGGIGTD